MNISEILAQNARKFPQKRAVIEGASSLSFLELDRRVNQLASSLLKLGIEKGDRVVLYMPNTLEFVLSYFAVLRIEAIVVPVNAKLTAPEVEYILEHSEAKALIAHQAIYNELQPLVSSNDLLWIKTGNDENGWLSFERLMEKGNTSPIPCTLREDDDATILYTSGTTGRPKGVLFTYRNILTVATMMALETKMDKQSRILHLMPLSHSAPLHLFFVAGMYVGATHILSPTFTPEALLELTSKHQITHFFGAPVAYLLTAKHPEIQTYNLSSVSYWVYGGAPLSKNEFAFIKEKFRPDRFMCVYGLTEAGPNGTYLSPEEHVKKAGSIGKDAALGCEIKIVDEQGHEAPPGEVGEIVLSGEGTMKGYFKDEEKTAEVLKDGWLYTGDLARRDEEGYVFVVDRKKDMIISGGVNIYPKEIEDILREHPAIAEVAVVGVPHPEWGETVKAFVVTTEPVENLEDECKRFLKGKMADYKIPRLYEPLPALPRNATGKILKQVLRKRGTSDEAITRS